MSEAPPTLTKVYVVSYDVQDSYSILGIFTTRAEAEAAEKKLGKNHDTEEFDIYESHHTWWHDEYGGEP